MLLYYDKYYDIFEFGSEILFDMGERRLKKRRKGSAGNIHTSGAHISVSASEGESENLEVKDDIRQKKVEQNMKESKYS